MKRPRPPSVRIIPSDPQAIDALYGLEPVFEPSAGGDAIDADLGAVQFAPVQCPYCGESYDAQLDLSGGSSLYIEDCQICCQPIEIAFEVEASGALRRLTTRRTD